MEVNRDGDIVEVVGWAKSTLVAGAAFDARCLQNPNASYQQRRKSWVEKQRAVEDARV